MGWEPQDLSKLGQPQIVPTTAPVAKAPGRWDPVDLGNMKMPSSSLGLPQAASDKPMFGTSEGSMNPFDYLKAVKQGAIGADQIDKLNPELATRTAGFIRDLKEWFPDVSIGAGYDATRAKHSPNSRHYSGGAVDVTPSFKYGKGGYVNTPENRARLFALAEKHNLDILDEWGEGQGGGNSHFHITLPRNMPKGTDMRKMPSGRERSGNNLEDFAKQYALSKGVDPDFAMRLFRQESNFQARDASGRPLTSSAGAVGIGQMLEGTAAKYLANRKKTWNDYLNSENLQIMVAVDHMADLLQQKAIGGNYARLAAAYNAGGGNPEEGTGLAGFDKRGRVDYRETRDYVARVMGIKPEQVDEYVLRGKGPKWSPDDIEKKRRLYAGQSVDGDAPTSLKTFTRQTIRNAVGGANELNPFNRTTGSIRKNWNPFAPPLDPDPEVNIQRSALPFMMLRNSVREDGTVDDNSWAANNYKYWFNKALLDIPGVIHKSMRPNEEYHKWYDATTSIMGDKGVLGVLQSLQNFAIAMPLSVFAAETVVPRLAAAAGSALTAAGAPTLARGVGSGMTWLMNQFPQFGGAKGLSTIPGAIASNFSESWLGSWLGAAAGHLAQKGAWNKTVGWAGVMGFEGMNRELQHQFNEGATLEEAWKPALAAGITNGAIGALVTAAVPTVTGGGLAFIRGIFGKGGMEVEKGLASLRSGENELFGAAGPKVAALLDGAWERLGSNSKGKKIQEFVTNQIDFVSKAMKETDRSWWMSLVKDSTQRMALIDMVAKNEAAAVDVADKLSTSVASLDRSAQGWEGAIKVAQNDLTAAQNRVADLNRRMQKALTADTTNSVNAFLAQKQYLKDIDDAFARNKGRGNAPLKDPDGKLTGEGKWWEAEKAATIKTMDRYRKNPWVRSYEASELTLTRAGGANDRLVEAQNNIFIKEKGTYEKFIDAYRLIRDNQQKMVDETNRALLSGKVPDYSNSITLTPRAGFTSAEMEEFKILQTRLVERANRALGTDGHSIPLVQQVLHEEVHRALQVAPGQATFATQMTLLENAEAAVGRMLSRKFKGGAAADALKTAKEEIGKTLTALKDTKKYTPEAFSNALGAFSRTRSMIQKILDTQTEEYPNGLPLSAFATKGDIEGALANPKLLNFLDDNMSKAASMLMDENAAETAMIARGIFEDVAAGRIGGAAAEPYTLVDRFNDLQYQSRRALNFLFGQVSKAATADDIVKTSAYSADRTAGMIAAARRLSDDVGEDFAKKLYSVLGLKPGERVPQKFGEAFARAIEGTGQPGSARAAMRDFFNANHTVNGRTVRGEDLLKPMQMFLEIQTALERFEAQDPGLAAMFREFYFRHKYPRRAEYEQRTGDSGRSRSVAYDAEKARSIPTIEAANARADAAWNEVQQLAAAQGKTFKSWEDFVYGFKGRPEGPTPTEQAAAALGVSPEKAGSLIDDILLGEPLTDPVQIVKGMIFDRFRVSANRQMLAQWEHTLGPEGLPLLARVNKFTGAAKTGEEITEEMLRSVRVPKNVQYRPGGGLSGGKFARYEYGSYTPLSEFPEFASYYGARGGAEQWYLHPQLAAYARDFLKASPGQAGESALRKLTGVHRALALMGAPFQFMFSLMSNATTLTGFNFAKAFGLIPLGEAVAEETPLLMLRALNAGLNPANYMRNIHAIPEDMMMVAKKNPMFKERMDALYGTVSKWGPVGETLGKMMKAPFNAMTGLDSLMNRMTMFNAISNAQLGAWTFYTGQIMQKQGADLLVETGGRYGAALALAEKHAADHVNRLFGVLPAHMISSRMRDWIYNFALAPQFFASKWNNVLDVFDFAIRGAGYRSSKGLALSPALAKQQRNAMSNFFVGTIIADVVGTNMMNFLINGHSSFENPAGHEFDIKLDEKTYIKSPFFSMFRPLVKAAYAGAAHGSGEAAFNAFMGQLHPFLNMVTAVTMGKDKGGQRIGPPEMWTAEGVKARWDWAMENLWSGVLPAFGWRAEANVPEGHGIGGGTFGMPMTGRDHWLSIFGLNPSAPMPFQVAAANKINVGLEYSKQQLSDQVRKRLELYSQLDPNSKEAFDMLTGIVQFATVEGVPVANKEMREYLKQWHPEGRYVMMDASALQNTIEAYIDPRKAANNRVDRRLRPMLAEKIDEYMNKSAQGYLSTGKFVPNWADVQEERMRREMGYHVPLHYIGMPTPYLFNTAPPERKSRATSVVPGQRGPGEPVYSVNPLKAAKYQKELH